MANIVLAGTVFSVVLLGSVNLFARGHLSATTLVSIQVFNPLLIIVLPWLFERSVLRPARAAKA
jgi:hypothetical protein